MASGAQNMERVLLRCNRCGRCLSDCPVYLETTQEPLSARGRLSLIEAYIRGEIHLTDRFRDILSKCILCGACSEACVAGISPHEIIHWIRVEAAKRQKMPLVKHFLLDKLLENGFVSALLRQGLRISKHFGLSDGIPWPPKTSFIDDSPSFIAGPEGGLNVGYFVGCIANQFLPDVGVSALHILRDSGCTAFIPKSQGCCGLPFFNAGDIDKARSLAMCNMEAFLREDVDYVIASCATGSAHLKDYKRLFQSDSKAQSFSSKVRDISEFLANEVLYAKRLRDKSFSSREKTARVTYHDPCHLRRRQKIFKEPRSLVQAIRGIEFIEMNHPERCCGHGGSFHIDHPDLSLDILRHKIDDIKETNADVVTTGCMACLLQLMEGMHLEGVNIRVLHIAQLIDQYCLNPKVF